MCQPQRGCQGKCQKKCSWSTRLDLIVYCVYRGAEPQTLVRHFPRHQVWGRHFPKHSSRHLPARSFGTSLDGRQDRNTSGHGGWKLQRLIAGPSEWSKCFRSGCPSPDSPRLAVRKPSAFEGFSVEPKVRLQGYGYTYNPFCSHSSRCLAVLA